MAGLLPNAGARWQNSFWKPKRKSVWTSEFSLVDLQSQWDSRRVNLIRVGCTESTTGIHSLQGTTTIIRKAWNGGKNSPTLKPYIKKRCAIYGGIVLNRG